MKPAEELFELADKLDAAANSRQRETSQVRRDALNREADKVGKAFSGSWLGYHARVYYRDLETPPPGAHFSQEWGMKDMYGSGLGSTGDWREFDRDEVIAHLRRAAKNPDLSDVIKAATQARKVFLRAKSDIISIISNEIGRNADSFLERELQRIGGLQPLSETEVVNIWMPSGQVMSRDMVAIGQGSQIPPHISVKAQLAVIDTSFQVCEAAAEICQKIASHLQRKDRTQRRSMLVGTNVFIGHGRSEAWRELRDFVRDRLKLPWDEFNRVPVAGITNIARLSEMLESAAFAFIVMTAEDELADGEVQARMNVIHEVGLFQGRLGFTRAIVLVEDGCKEFSNIQGLGQIRFPSGRIRDVFEDVRLVLEREGLIEPD